MRKHVIWSTLVAMLIVSAVALAQTGGPKGMPGTATMYGKTLGEWSAAWWQWAYSMPVTQHPLFDTADCSAGQTGHIWFLGGKMCASSATYPELGCPPDWNLAAVRSCKVPTGTALVFPILNDEDSFAEEAPGFTESDLRFDAKAWAEPADNFVIAATIDGRVLRPARICPGPDVACSEQQSPLFTYTLAEHDNVLAAMGYSAADGSSSQSVSDGYFILLPPLPAGQHTIAFNGRNGGFSLNITYNITVVP